MQNKTYEKHEFSVQGKRITLYPSDAQNMPVIYLNTFENEGERVLAAVRERCAANFTLVAIGDLNWDHDMSPWSMPPLFKGDAPCTGGADEYLRLLTEQIAPRAEELVKRRAAWSGLAGYSLAGLFALYALYQSPFFSRIASVSGSLWFANFKDFALTREMKAAPECVYFSLGDKERMAKNPMLQSVQENTEQIARFYAHSGIQTTFELNDGNHFQNAIQRTAAGIAWLLGR
ncbi:alpha/beta hydrolase [Campylobacter curvus]|uniref:alpha/beta hydrolase n=1 Tax=Campylobacter curvus TaxID=200 RepID=UPI0014705F35|nr:alpha/beta hydrolase-fold protein [Campylobacter curvus]